MALDNFITLTDRMLYQITEDQLISLDIEGAIRNVSQISIINGNGKVLYNQMAPFLPFPKGHSEEQHKIIQQILNRAVYIIGFSTNCDLKILSEAGFSIKPYVKCIDVQSTFDWMKRQHQIDKKKVTAGTLKGVAEYFGIKNIQGYHTSNVDATITLEVFKKMYDLNKGVFCTVKPKISIKEDSMIRLPSATAPIVTAEPQSRIYKINSNLYEGLLTIGDTKIVVRMTADEYKLYERICRYEPYYTLDLFYNTILNPAEVRKIESMIEEDRRRELEAKEEKEQQEALKENPSQEPDDKPESSVKTLDTNEGKKLFFPSEKSIDENHLKRSGLEKESGNETVDANGKVEEPAKDIGPLFDKAAQNSEDTVEENGEDGSKEKLLSELPVSKTDAEGKKPLVDAAGENANSIDADSNDIVVREPEETVSNAAESQNDPDEPIDNESGDLFSDYAPVDENSESEHFMAEKSDELKEGPSKDAVIGNENPLKLDKSL